MELANRATPIFCHESDNQHETTNLRLVPVSGGSSVISDSNCGKKMELADRAAPIF